MIGDLVVITADHGNDPTWHGTDHTREHTPILASGRAWQAGPIGRRESFADIGASVLLIWAFGVPEEGSAWL